MSQYSILVFGGDHINTLTTVRCLGRAKVFSGLLLGNSVSLNECKFSQSGLIYSIVERGIPLLLMWITSLVFESAGEHVKFNSSHEESFVNERYLLSSIVKREEKMAFALKRPMKAKRYVYWAKGDLRGSIAWYR